MIFASEYAKNEYCDARRRQFAYSQIFSPLWCLSQNLKVLGNIEKKSSKTALWDHSDVTVTS